eukprot:57560-Prymnesium_polylepis.1
MSVMVRTIEQNSKGTRDLAVDANEAEHFMKRMVAGETLRRETSMGGDDLVAAFELAQQAVAEKLFTALRGIQVFGGLDDAQLTTLRDAMALAPYDEGDYIFEQDDDGDTFYVITKGEAR